MAENAKQVIDIHVSKGMTGSQSNEHLRNRSDKAKEFALTKGNYDFSREHLNFEIGKGGTIRPIDKSKSIPLRMAENLKARGIKDPNEGLDEPKYRTVVNFIFGGSRERMRELAFGDQKVDYEQRADNSHITRQKDIENWAKEVYSFVSDRYGEENIAAFVVHLDESNPHIHCTLLPIQDNKFAYKKIFAGKDKYEFSQRIKQLHNDFAELNRKWGLERGTSVAETGAKHRSTEEYRRHLSQECTTIEQQIAAHKKALSDLQVEIRLAERRVKGLTSMISNLTKELSAKESELYKLSQELSAHKGDEQSLKERMVKLQSEIEAIQTKLADKQEKLSTADRQLSALKEDMDAIEERTDELRAEAMGYSKQIHSRVDNLLRDVLLENLVNEHHSLSAQMSRSERELFDSSLIASLVDKGSQIMHCATMLFLGLVDDATTFAENCGGGGTRSDMKWGRNDDEDDRAWARRCMMMANRMLHLASGKKSKR